MGCCNTPSTCIREHISAALIRPLRYVRGVDAEGCVSYADASTLAITVADTNTLDLTLAGGTLSGQVRISAAANNILTALGDGLFVPRAPVQGVSNSQTLTLTLSTAGILSGSVNISPNAGNQLQVLPNGLFVPAPPTPFITAVADTNTIDLNVAAGTLTAQAIISPNPGNQLQALPNGLFVPPSAAGITVSDTPTVDLTLSSGNLTADVIVSPNAGNQLQTLPNGLFVPPYRLQDCAGNTVNDGDRVVRCVTANPVALPVNTPLIGVAPNTAYQVSPVACNAAPITHDVVVMNGNVVAATRDGLNRYLGLLASMPIASQSVPVTNPITNVTIDSVNITNPSNCRWMMVIIRLFGVSTETSVNESAPVFARAGINIVDTLLGFGVATINCESRVVSGTPGITNSPISANDWLFNSETGGRIGYSFIPPSGTHTFERRYFGVTNGSNPQFYYASCSSQVQFYGFLMGDY